MSKITPMPERMTWQVPADAQPAPAPLPVDVEKALNILEDYEHDKPAEAVRAYIATQAQRIKELEAASNE